jgi:DNA repair protein RecO (recombination protein O)
MLYKTRGIVLHRIKYGDTSLIAYVYTEKYGRKAYLVKGAYKKNPTIGVTHFRPLQLLDMEVYNKSGHNLQKIKEVVINPPLTSISVNPVKNTISLFIAEVLYRTIREEEANKNLFSFLYNAIQLFDIKNSNIDDFHLIFLVQLSKYLGFFPTNNFNAQNTIFDLINGKFVNAIPLHGKYISMEIAHDLSILMNKSMDLKEELFNNKNRRIVLLEVLSEFYYLHAEGTGRIKSLRILKEIFA